jgi:hypothetical protein
MSTVLAFKKVKEKQRRKVNVKHSCVVCKRVYLEDNIISHFAPNHGYYHEAAIRYCLKCFNLKHYT